jgi:hypothetical protein
VPKKIHDLKITEIFTRECHHINRTDEYHFTTKQGRKTRKKGDLDPGSHQEVQKEKEEKKASNEKGETVTDTNSKYVKYIGIGTGSSDGNGRNSKNHESNFTKSHDPNDHKTESKDNSHKVIETTTKAESFDKNSNQNGNSEIIEVETTDLKGTSGDKEGLKSWLELKKQQRVKEKIKSKGIVI